MLSVSKPASLVEQKKQQWAREREEMSQLYTPWSSGERYKNRMQPRNQFASTLELNRQPYDYQETMQRHRSPSLPPIHHGEPDRIKDEKRTKEVLIRNIPSAKRFAFYDEDCEGDTSGYGSETVHIRSGLHNVSSTRNPVIVWHQNNDGNKNMQDGRLAPSDSDWLGRSPRSSADEGRPRWGDRGVATGRLWEPTAPNERLPQMQNQKKGTPSWVERGLNMIDNSADVLVIDQRSSTNSGFECDSCNGSDEGRTFLRGQNVPIEPEIKAQRENKRMKALELQSAILNQLEDREKRRQEEREIKLREERMEELRILQQQEEDRLRLEEEKRKNEEKQMLEQRKLESLKKALEEAERKAKLEKEKRFNCLKQSLQKSGSENIIVKNENINTDENVMKTEPVSPSKTSRTYDVLSAQSQKKESSSQHTTGFNSPRSVGQSSLNLFIHSVPPMAVSDNHFNIVPIGVTGNGEIVNASTGGLQLAVLVPQTLNNNLYNVSFNPLNNFIETTETKVLTPSKYRVKTKDVYTQTDYNFIRNTSDKIIETEAERNSDKDYSHLDENMYHDSQLNTLKKDRRLRPEERYTKRDLDNRPKWGVNRPAAQYKKQSEKDPFYSQKRKMRQKYRTQARQYLSQSSDDSRSPSPPTRSDKINIKPRHSLSQSYWKNKRPSQNLSKSNNESETTSIVVEFTHIDQLSANETKDSNKTSPKVSPSKRITLSQKFINDKYGNRKLWVDETNEKHMRSYAETSKLDAENRKKIIDQINTAKKDFLDATLERHEI